MSENTKKLDLFKCDTEADKKNTFNIDLLLNNNWDKLENKISISEYSTNATYSSGCWVRGVVNNKRSLFESLIDDNKNNNLADKNAWKNLTDVFADSSLSNITDAGKQVIKDNSLDINNYQVNNVYSYGMSQYYKGVMNNNSWLRSAGQWNSGTVYNGVYEWAVAQQVAGVDGFKLSTGTYTDYDWVINTEEQTFRLPLLDGSETLLGNAKQTFTLTNKAFHSPSVNGYYLVRKTISTSDQYIYMGIYTQDGTVVTGNSYMYSSSSGTGVITSPLVRKGQKLYVQTTLGGDDVETTFVPAVGNGNLYYYIGDTLQNADLINIARMQEQVINKVDQNGPIVKLKGTATLGDTPSSRVNQGALYFYDANGTLSAIIQNYIETESTTGNSKNGLQLICRKPDNSGWGNSIDFFTNSGGKTYGTSRVLTGYVNGTSGYRIWTADDTGNRFCEQWGIASFAMRNSDTTITFIKPFANLNYSITLGNYSSTESNPFVKEKATTYFKGSRAYTGSSANAGNCHWYARGYIA